MTTEASVRSEVARWLEANWSPDMSLSDWRELLADSGWGCPVWPAEWCGRGLPPAMESVVAEEFRKSGAVGVPAGGVWGWPASRSWSTAPTT